MHKNISKAKHGRSKKHCSTYSKRSTANAAATKNSKTTFVTCCCGTTFPSIIEPKDIKFRRATTDNA